MASLFSCKSSSSKVVVDSEEYRVSVEKNLHNWNIPKEKIYKTGFFKSNKLVRTEKQTMPLSTADQIIRLLPQEHLYRFQDEDCSLHVGLVQLAVGPLTRQGINGTSVVLCLQDNRHSKFEDSLLGKLQFSLCDGPIYFNCFPNFLVSLMDRRVFDCLNLSIKTNGYNMVQGSLPIALEFRVVYKIMKKTPAVPKALAEYPGGRVLLEEKIGRSNAVFPASVKWSEVEDA